MGVLQLIWLCEIMGCMLLMYQNTTMRVYGAQIKRYCVLGFKGVYFISIEPQARTRGNIQKNRTGKVTFVIFGSGNGLSPLRYQAIIQTNDILFSWSKNQNTKQSCSNFHSLILFEIYYRGVYVRISHTKWSFCSALIVLRSSTLHT